MDKLESIKINLIIDKEIEDEYSNELLELLIKRAYARIIGYLGKNFSFDYIIEKYSDAVFEVASLLYDNRKIKNSAKGIKSKTQGQRSVTYSDTTDVITDDIKSMLPPPYVGVM